MKHSCSVYTLVRGSIATTMLLAIACTAQPEAGRPASGTTAELPATAFREYPIEDFMGITSYTGASFSPDGTKLLVSSDAGSVWNAYRIPIGGGDPKPLTDSTTESILAQSYFPNDERFLYQSDQGGNELDHVYVRESDGSVNDLTPGDSLKADFAGWAHDRQSFFITSNERDERFFDLYEYRTTDYTRELLFKNDDGYNDILVSPNKRFLALGKTVTTNDSDVYLHDRETGETKLLTAHDGNAASRPMDFSPDNAWFLYTSNDGHEFSRLMSLEMATGKSQEALAPEWDVLDAQYSETGKYLVVRINRDARTEIRVVETADRRRIELPSMDAAEITSLAISPDEKRMAFYMSRSRNPRDLFVWDIGGDAPIQLTHSLNPNIDPAHLVEPEVVRFKSYDGVEIPGILYKPHQAGKNTLLPALVMVHGGPGGQSRVGYNNLLQYLVNHGYVVYAINNRGSSGYGKTFRAMDDRRHGEADLDDCVASKQFLVNTGYVDPQRIGIIGGSYGGYMTLAALAFRPEEFAVGVDIFGVANWPRTLENIPKWWESFREALYAEMGDPAEDAERLRRISPVFHAGNIVRPLMVLQGANDPRVLQAESDDMVQAARENGAVVEYVVFPDEGHGFAKKENQLRGYKAILEFLDTYLAAPA